MKMRTHLLIVALFFPVACAPTKTWIATPLKQTYDNQYIQIEFVPQKNYQLYYDSFLIVVTNKTAQQMEIDWNRSRYLFNGKPYGAFGFEGITKDDINNLPSDTVPPKETLTKNIFPLNLIAWKPYGSEFKDTPAFSAGPVPEGTSGVALAFKLDNQLRQATLAVSIRAETKR